MIKNHFLILPNYVNSQSQNKYIQKAVGNKDLTVDSYCQNFLLNGYD